MSSAGQTPPAAGERNTLATWGIRNPVPAMMLFFVLCVAGLWGFHKLPIARFPDIAFPMTVVTISQPGASPSQLETEVARKVEDSVATLDNVKRVTSTVVEGVSTTAIEFNLDADLMTALNDTKDAVTRIRMDLPQDIQEPIVSKVEIGGSLLTYAVAAPGMADDELSWFVDRYVTRALYGVDGVAAVNRIGGVDRMVRVDLDPQALEAYGVTAGEVSQQLALTQVERPGGKAELGGESQTIRTIATVADAQQLADFSITLGDGRSVRLSSLARVHDATADATQLALLDGKPVVGFSMSRSRGADELLVRDHVKDALATLAKEHPGVSFQLITDMTQETEDSYTSSMEMLWEGALLALAVVFLFLRDWRATWVSAIALPLSIIPTFAVIHWLGFSLNMITLLALSVVVGILVDDAIVEIENIVRHLGMGKKPLEAARDAANEIGVAVIATSATLAAVFVPVAFMPGIPGKFFREFGWTAATAVMFSLLVARLLTPMMAANLLKPHPDNVADSKVMKRYLGWVDWVLHNRWKTLGMATLFFIASLAMVPFIPATFIPPADSGRSMLSPWRSASVRSASRRARASPSLSDSSNATRAASRCTGYGGSGGKVFCNSMKRRRTSSRGIASWCRRTSSACQLGQSVAANAGRQQASSSHASSTRFRRVGHAMEVDRISDKRAPPRTRSTTLPAFGMPGRASVAAMAAQGTHRQHLDVFCRTRLAIALPRDHADAAIGFQQGQRDIVDLADVVHPQRFQEVRLAHQFLAQDFLEQHAVTRQHPRHAFDDVLGALRAGGGEGDTVVQHDQRGGQDECADDGVVAAVQAVLHRVADEDQQHQVERRELADRTLAGDPDQHHHHHVDDDRAQHEMPPRCGEMQQVGHGGLRCGCAFLARPARRRDADGASPNPTNDQPGAGPGWSGHACAGDAGLSRRNLPASQSPMSCSTV